MLVIQETNWPMDLQPDETLIWAGQSCGSGYGFRRLFPQAMAGLVMIAAAAGWIALMVWSASPRPGFAGGGFRLGEHDFQAIVISVPLLLTGSYLATMPLRLARRLAGTRYLLSDHRAVIIATDRPRTGQALFRCFVLSWQAGCVVVLAASKPERPGWFPTQVPNRS